MFKEIEYIRANHAFKRTTGTYLQYGSWFLIGPIIIVMYAIFIFSDSADFDEKIALGLMAIGFTVFLFSAAKQWQLNYSFEAISNKLTKEENLKIIISVAKSFNLDIIENNIHRTMVTLKGRTTSFSLGSLITLIYSDNEILVNSRPTTGISPSPFFRLDYDNVTSELMKAGDSH